MSGSRPSTCNSIWQWQLPDCSGRSELFCNLPCRNNSTPGPISSKRRCPVWAAIPPRQDTIMRRSFRSRTTASRPGGFCIQPLRRGLLAVWAPGTTSISKTRKTIRYMTRSRLGCMTPSIQRLWQPSIRRVRLSR